MKDVAQQLKTIQLNLWDKLFLMGLTLLTIWLFVGGMSILTFGGLVLIYGAFLTYKGQIYLSAFTYLTADFCWVYNAWGHDDFKGVVFISVGIVFGMLATYKMKNGYMEKDLLKR